MKIHGFNQVGELNPQLFREIKGRFNRRNLTLATGVSLLAQLCVYLSFLSREFSMNVISLSSKYCNLKETYEQYDKKYTQIQSQLYSSPTNDLSINREALEVKLSELSQLMNANCPPDAINSSLWWRDYWAEIFMMLSVFGFFALIIIGSYMLINDLATEKRRGTLNFIQLSPQTYKSIFVGKILGVPSLLYLAIALFIPYHIGSGISAGIPILEIFSFYAVVVASCAFFYSFSLLFGLMTLGQSGFQAWLGSGFIFTFLMLANNKPIYQDGSDWLNLFCPSFLLRYLIDGTSSSYLYFPFNQESIQVLKWFELPLGTSITLILLFSLLHFGILTFWIWQGLKRCFHNPDATLFSKQQSYWITGCLTVINLGFLIQDFELKTQSSIIYAVVFNFLLFFALIAALSPQRQTLQDWARYRQEKVNGKPHLMSDLMYGERSPSVVAIGLNLVIVIALFGLTTLWIGLPDERLQILAALLLNVSLIWLCASLVQLVLLMRTPKRGFWAVGMVGAIIISPLIILAFFGLQPRKEPLVFLLSSLSFAAVEYATIPLILTAIVGQSMVTVLLNLKLTQQLKKAGESTSKALLSGRSA
ncbi:hypothetical protein [Lyngbya sp. PCC 8106]|uniref:hypothetical protein n=1 Tax=Lyngbya sp. (strain PCC 8106) TaxID=313612 RepID=UPI0000EA9BE6|nr:hypothetical protein [Lyngbya sp. PCC 8106]EAW37370.1 hypothetical protein L8106_12760 [Lyngbya sp. PCC 8106]